MLSRHREEEEVQLHPYSTLALEGVQGPELRPGRFTSPEEIRYPLHRMLSGPHSHQCLNSDHATPNVSLYRLHFALRRFFVNC